MCNSPSFGRSDQLSSIFTSKFYVLRVSGYSLPSLDQQQGTRQPEASFLFEALMTGELVSVMVVVFQHKTLSHAFPVTVSAVLF